MNNNFVLFENAYKCGFKISNETLEILLRLQSKIYKWFLFYIETNKPNQIEKNEWHFLH